MQDVGALGHSLQSIGTLRHGSKFSVSRRGSTREFISIQSCDDEKYRAFHVLEQFIKILAKELHTKAKFVYELTAFLKTHFGIGRLR